MPHPSIRTPDLAALDGEAPRLFQRRLHAATVAAARADLRADLAEAAARDADHLRWRNQQLRRALWHARSPQWSERLAWAAGGALLGALLVRIVTGL